MTDDATAEELWRAQTIQQAYDRRMRAARPRFSLAKDGFADVRKWVSAGRAAAAAGLSPDDFVSMVFNLHDLPPPWRFIQVAGRLKTGKIVSPDADLNAEEQIREKLKWAISRFSSVGEPDSDSYREAMANLPLAIGVPAWIRVLLGFRYPEVLRIWMPDAKEFFNGRPDIVDACRRMGFPPQLFETPHDD